MSLFCGSNSLLVALNAAKKSLTNKVNGLISEGKAALSDLQAKANAMKASLLAMIPKIPKLPNFKEDLAALIGNNNAQALADFQKKWGKAVSNIQAFIDKLPNIDFCNEVPNVDGKIQEDGTYAPVVKAQDSPTPSENSQPVEPLTSTVQNSAAQTSSGNSQSTHDQFYSYIRQVSPQIRATYWNLVEKKLLFINELDKVTKSKPWVEVLNQIIRTKSGSLEEYKKTHTLTTNQALAADKIINYKNAIGSLYTVSMQCMAAESIYQDVLAGIKPMSYWTDYLANTAKDDYKIITLKYFDPNTNTSIIDATYKLVPQKIQSILDQNKDLAIGYTTYLSNKRKS